MGKGNNPLKLPRVKQDEQAFGLAEGGYVICDECKAVFFNKHWHHTLDEAFKGQDVDKFAEKKVKFADCPACKMKKEKVFEGEVVIKINAGDTELKNQVLHAVNNSDKQAQDRDPMDRVLWIDEKPGEILVYTSENQLAVKIGKKLNSAFKGGTLEIKHSPGVDTSRVIWTKLN